MSALLEVRNLTTRIPTRNGILTIVNDVGFTLHEGECFGLVGESGSGKSMVCRSILRLPPTSAELTEGQVLFDGLDLVRIPERELNELRGRQIAMIVQDAIAALNPVLPVGRQIAEAMLEHGVVATRAAARERSIELMRKVGIPSPEARIDNYPFEFSGGMCQRVVIAAALACNPRVILADEPTTALDATVQIQILLLLRELQRELGLSVILVTHDIGVAVEVADRIAVMYAGRIVEQAPVRELFAAPRHRYTRALLDTMPAMNPPGAALPSIAGMVPPPGRRGAGCAFAPRCGATLERCRLERPDLAGGTAHRFACWNPAT